MSICSKCNRHYYYMEIAGDVAKNSTSHYLHGCVIVKGGVIISTGYNNYSKGKYRSIHSMHAEMDAIRKLPPLYKSRMISIDLIIIRINKEGLLRNSAPCCKCLEHLSRMNSKTKYRLRHIYYSTASGGIIKEKFTDLLNSDTKHMSLRFRRLQKK